MNKVAELKNSATDFTDYTDYTDFKSKKINFLEF
jgi:hypothetical protein